jgi:uncharacterized protein (DUF305 family)
MKGYASGFAFLLILSAAVRVPAWQTPAHQSPADTGAGVAWSELGHAMESMQGEMKSTNPSGNDDLDFAKLMLPHHRAAIDMAKTELVYGKDPQMRRLAQEIVTDQQSETELMQLWLKQHGPGSQK